jgi:hypothetical protein
MQCFYVPGSLHIIDTATTSGLSTICKETLVQIRVRYPNAELRDFDEVLGEIEQLNEQRFNQPPIEINEERWNEMMGVLPPMKWRSGCGAESFMICEATVSHFHSIFCKVSDRYFEMTDSKFLTHEEIVGRCNLVLMTLV